MHEINEALENHDEEKKWKKKKKLKKKKHAIKDLSLTSRGDLRFAIVLGRLMCL